VLEVSRHGNKLRPGHLRGNRFTIWVRGGDLSLARAAGERLGETGLPNFFGPQRFGGAGDNAAVGKALLTGAQTPEARRAGRDRFLRRLTISAYQSLLFNRWLTERMGDGLFATAIAGDVLKKLESGGLFVCEDPAADGPRVLRFEVSPAGPMFGHKLKPLATGIAGEREARILAAEEMSLASFARGGGEAEGTRRAARIPIAVELAPALEPGSEPAGSPSDGYIARFELPKGSYATVVLRELMKGEEPALAEAEE
jgi:tRNA pseudouridine13 synthase